MKFLELGKKGDHLNPPNILKKYFLGWGEMESVDCAGTTSPGWHTDKYEGGRKTTWTAYISDSSLSKYLMYFRQLLNLHLSVKDFLIKETVWTNRKTEEVLICRQAFVRICTEIYDLCFWHINDILISQIQGSFSVFASLKTVGKRDNLSRHAQIIQQNIVT
jgi:hypothetical protein